MARNSKGNPSKEFGDGRSVSKATGNRSNQLRWLSPYLDSEDQVWLQGNADNLERFVFNTLGELPAGYTLSSKFDAHTDRWLATLICDRVDDANRGIAITGRGSTRANSIYTCLYIAGVKLEWSWSEDAGQNLGDFG